MIGMGRWYSGQPRVGCSVYTSESTPVVTVYGADPIQQPRPGARGRDCYIAWSGNSGRVQNHGASTDRRGTPSCRQRGAARGHDHSTASFTHASLQNHFHGCSVTLTPPAARPPEGPAPLPRTTLLRSCAQQAARWRARRGGAPRRRWRGGAGPPRRGARRRASTRGCARPGKGPCVAVVGRSGKTAVWGVG